MEIKVRIEAKEPTKEEIEFMIGSVLESLEKEYRYLKNTKYTMGGIDYTVAGFSLKADPYIDPTYSYWSAKGTVMAIMKPVYQPKENYVLVTKNMPLECCINLYDKGIIVS